MSEEAKLDLQFKDSSWFIAKLTYQGSTKHCIINFSLILICLLVTCVPFWRIKTVWGKYLLFFLYLLLFQILLWFIFSLAQGVSIVWCGQLGWINVSVREKPYVNVGVGLLVISAIGYYLYIMPLITTVAHVLGILMGHGLSLIILRKEWAHAEMKKEK